jgi:serine O-acetyltransferase
MFENMKRDYFASRKKQGNVARILLRVFRDSGFRAVALYRTGRWCRKRRLGVVAVILERLMHHTCHCWISTLAEIGPGFKIAHVCGIVIPPAVVFGRDCDIRQNVTLGDNYGKVGEDGRANPWIGDNVSLGAGAVVLGSICVGSNSIVGANAVLTKSVAENSVVGAFRAEVIAERSSDGSIMRPDRRMFVSRRELFERIELLEKRLSEVEGRSDKGPYSCQT